MAVTAGAGIVVGVVLALWALASTVIARAVLGGVVWGWLVALASVAVMASRQRELSSPRLGIFDVPGIPGGPGWLVGPNQMIIISAGVAAGIAWYGRRAGAGRLLTALSGLACPALIASAYVLAGPGFRDQNDQLEAYFAALAATVAGLLVGLLFALWKRPTEAAPVEEEPAESDAVTWPAATV
jgi:xanthosine utilization system XapX-like protein